jgi:hypothetical protein
VTGRTHSHDADTDCTDDCPAQYRNGSPVEGPSSSEPRVIGAINPVGFSAGGGFRFTHRYEADCPRGEATLWAMSDGTVRCRNPDDVATPAREGT